MLLSCALPASREYDAFGTINSNSATGTWPNRFGYQGQAWIEILYGNGNQRLLVSHARLFDPVDGRFLQNEPLPSRRARSQYLYAAQSPVDFADPLGLFRINGFLQGVSNVATEPFKIPSDLVVAVGTRIMGIDAEDDQLSRLLGQRQQQRVFEGQSWGEAVVKGVGEIAASYITGGGYGPAMHFYQAYELYKQGLI